MLAKLMVFQRKMTRTVFLSDGYALLRNMFVDILGGSAYIPMNWPFTRLGQGLPTRLTTIEARGLTMEKLCGSVEKRKV
jgi:hypothetical protein